MTEAEWLNCADPKPMVDFLVDKTKSLKPGSPSGRKLRLFAVACCYRVWQWMPDERTRIGVETAERYADGLVGEDELENASKGTAGAWTAIWGMGWHIYQSARAAHFSLDQKVDVLAMAAQEVVGAYGNHIMDILSCTADSEPVKKAMSQETLNQLGLLRDIFGNPFRPPPIDPSWLTWNDGTVVQLAEGIYDNRAFDRLPILADALEEAGGQDADVLEHCRQPGPHARGCWVVDLLTGRSENRSRRRPAT